MPQIQRSSQVVRKGQQNRTDIKRVMRPEFARDNLAQAFAGNENKGPSRKQKTFLKSTHLRSRKTKASAGKTPKR